MIHILKYHQLRYAVVEGLLRNMNMRRETLRGTSLRAWGPSFGHGILLNVFLSQFMQKIAHKNDSA
jgi:hypothetical protein